MVKKIFGMIALAAFIATSGIVFANSNQTLERWFYVEDTGFTNPMTAPGCVQVIPDDCAYLYESTDGGITWNRLTGPGTVATGFH